MVSCGRWLNGIRLFISFQVNFLRSTVFYPIPWNNRSFQVRPHLKDEFVKDESGRWSSVCIGKSFMNFWYTIWLLHLSVMAPHICNSFVIWFVLSNTSHLASQKASEAASVSMPRRHYTDVFGFPIQWGNRATVTVIIHLLQLNEQSDSLVFTRAGPAIIMYSRLLL